MNETLFFLLLCLGLFGVILFWMSEQERRKHEQAELEILRSINRTLGLVLVSVDDIRSLLKRSPILTKARIILMPKTIQVGQTAQAVIQGFDQFGNPMPIDSSYQVSYNASNPADVSFSPVNPDGSDTITGVNPDPGDVIGATITGGPNNVSVTAATDVLVINPATPVLTTAKVVLQ